MILKNVESQLVLLILALTLGWEWEYVALSDSSIWAGLIRGFYVVLSLAWLVFARRFLMAEVQSSGVFRPVNQSLGQQPSLGPIPANLVAPSAVILLGFYGLLVVLLRLKFAWFLLLSVWGIATWWVVVGEKPWKFTHKFVRVPDWTRGYVVYTSYWPDDYDDNQAARGHETLSI